METAFLRTRTKIKMLKIHQIKINPNLTSIELPKKQILTTSKLQLNNSLKENHRSIEIQNRRVRRSH